jgi:transcriptional regulator with XRE-family HTH domain
VSKGEAIRRFFLMHDAEDRCYVVAEIGIDDMDLVSLTRHASRGAQVLVGKHRVSNAELARVVGVERAQVGRWLSGGAQPRQRSLRRLRMLAVLAQTTDALCKHVRKEVERDA